MKIFLALIKDFCRNKKIGTLEKIILEFEQIKLNIKRIEIRQKVVQSQINGLELEEEKVLQLAGEIIILKKSYDYYTQKYQELLIKLEKIKIYLT